MSAPLSLTTDALTSSNKRSFMAAPSIPNLNTLRSSRGGLRARRGGRAVPVFDVDEDESIVAREKARDKIIQQTDQDASLSRISAVTIGYLEDPFARGFVEGQVTRRYPIIHRGTYVRTTAIDSLVDRFLASYPAQPKQILSLGAGSDTRMFRLFASNPYLKLVYHELDFESNTIQKIKAVQHSRLHLETLQGSLRHQTPQSEPTISSASLTSPTYNIHPLDLRSFTRPTTVPNLPNVDPTLPTLLLSECCLCYLPPADTEAILHHLTQTLFPPSTPLALVLYEPIRPYDPFGQTMVSNLASRGIHMQTLKKYSTLQAQRERLKLAGFSTGQGARDVDRIWTEWIGEGEKERVAGLEMLDEVEEWKLLARHYCVAWGWRDVAGKSSSVFTEAWSGIDGGLGAGEEDDEIG
ncbi:hypothetical protein LTR66_008059 [Elasticomyces elasticus]|nr:hypothetical protein LTR66_008059 [Elasticomyces elasticus]